MEVISGRFSSCVREHLNDLRVSFGVRVHDGGKVVIIYSMHVRRNRRPVDRTAVDLPVVCVDGTRPAPACVQPAVRTNSGSDLTIFRAS